MLGVFAACSLWVSIAPTQPAPTQPAPNPSAAVQLDWRAPQACPGPDVVQREIAALLSEAGAIPKVVTRARGRVTMNNAGSWTVKLALDVEGQATERSITGTGCAEMSSAAAFIIATAIDPRVAGLPPPAPPEPPTSTVTAPPPPQIGPSPSPPSDTGPAVADPPVADPAVATPPVADPAVADGDNVDDSDAGPASERAPIRLAPGLLAGVGFGPNPSVGAVVGGTFAVVGRAWRSDFAAQYWTPSDARSSEVANVRIGVQAWDLVVRGCWVPQWQRWEFPLCGGVGGGAVHGQGQGDDVSGKSAAGLWLRVLAGPGATLRLGRRIALGATVHGYATLATSAFSTEPAGLARHRPRAGGVSGTIRVELRLR